MKIDNHGWTLRLALTLLGGVFLAAVAAAQRGEQRREQRSDDAYEALIEKLELGMVALQELGRHDALDVLARVADEVRAERRRAREVRARGQREERGAEGDAHEHEALARHTEILRVARAALMEAGRRDGADQLERAIHQHELLLAGRTERAAQAGGPNARQVAGLLEVAAELYQDWGNPDRAEWCMALARHVAESHAERAEEGRQEEGGANAERREARRQLKVLRYAVEAFLEADHRDRADLVERAMHARELALEGRSDGEAMHIRESAPKLANLVELLGVASRICAQHGQEERAHALAQLAGQWGGKLRARDPEPERLRQQADERRSREGDRDRRREELDARIQRFLDYSREPPREAPRAADDALEHIGRRLLELQRAIDELRAEIGRLHRGDARAPGPAAPGGPGPRGPSVPGPSGPSRGR